MDTNYTYDTMGTVSTSWEASLKDHPYASLYAPATPEHAEDPTDEQPEPSETQSMNPCVVGSSSVSTDNTETEEVPESESQHSTESIVKAVQELCRTIQTPQAPQSILSDPPSRPIRNNACGSITSNISIGGKESSRKRMRPSFPLPHQSLGSDVTVEDTTGTKRARQNNQGKSVVPFTANMWWTKSHDLAAVPQPSPLQSNVIDLTTSTTSDLGWKSFPKETMGNTQRQPVAMGVEPPPRLETRPMMSRGIQHQLVDSGIGPICGLDWRAFPTAATTNPSTNATKNLDVQTHIPCIGREQQQQQQQHQHHMNQFTAASHSNPSYAVVNSSIDTSILFPDEANESKKMSRAEKSAAKDEEWTQFYHELIRFKDKHGTTIVPIGDRTYPELSEWAWAQAQALEDRKMKKKHYDLLVSIGFEFSKVKKRSNKRWTSMCQRYEIFRQTYRHANIRYITIEDPELANWIKRTRVIVREDGLSDFRLRMLNEVLTKLKNTVSIDFGPIDFGISLVDNWDTMFEKLKAFVLEHGVYADVQLLKGGSNSGILNWLRSQRQNYYQKKITEQQEKLLDSIGFRWKSSKWKKYSS